MDAVAVVDRVRALGVTMTSNGNKILLTPGSKVPKELIEAIRENKAAIMAILNGPSALQRALDQKTQEIAVLHRRLMSPYYANDRQYHQWCLDQIGCLTAHINEIRRFLSTGGSLTLPSCCKGEYICLIAMRRFDGCLMLPGECTFAISNG